MSSWEVCPIFCSRTEGFPVAYIRIIGLYPLNFLFYELIVCRRYSLLLLRRAIHSPFFFNICRRGMCWESVTVIIIRRGVVWHLLKVFLTSEGRLGVKRCCRGSHVYGPHVTAVAASHCHCVHQAAAWNAYRKKNIAKLARDVAEFLRDGIYAARHVYPQRFENCQYPE